MERGLRTLAHVCALRRALLLGYVFVLAVASACAPEPYTMRGTVREPSTAVPDLALSDSGGRAFTFARLRGRVAVVYFGFTSCPDLCPTTLAEFMQVKTRLGPDAASVDFVFVTLDPDRDTPTTIARYLALFDPSFIGLTGTPDQLAAARAAFGVSATRRELSGSAMAYTIDHSSLSYVIDRNGRWREQFEHGTPVADMVGDLRALLRKEGT
jgi:protein SCO1